MRICVECQNTDKKGHVAILPINDNSTLKELKVKVWNLEDSVPQQNLLFQGHEETRWYFRYFNLI